MTGTRFEVNLGEVELPPLLAKQIESDIRSIVLTSLARLDSGGIRRINWSIRDPWGQTLGMTLDPRWPDPFDPGGGSGSGGLDIRDHEIVVSAVLKNAVQIVKELGVQDRASKPTGTEVLKACLSLETIEDGTKSKIRDMLSVIDRLGDPYKTMPPQRKKAMSAVKKRISGRPTAEQASLLRSRDFSEQIDDPEVREALPYAARILEDGASTIYSDDHPFFDTFAGPTPTASKKDKVDGLKDTDYLGGVAGGAAGTAVPGVGTAAGAAGGAAAASAGYAIAWLIDSIF